MAVNQVVLHQWEVSPFCQKVARMLKFKGIAYEAVNYNGILGAKVPGLSKVGKVPVLDIDGKRIQDSTRIARYLDEVQPEPALYPADPMQRAMAELWEDWADELLYFYEVYFRVFDAQALEKVLDISAAGRPAYERAVMKPLLKTALKLQVTMQGTGRMAAADVEAEFLRHLDRIALVLGATGWLVGEQQTIADIAVGSQLMEIVRTHSRMRSQIYARPAIAAWLDQL